MKEAAHRRKLQVDGNKVPGADEKRRGPHHGDSNRHKVPDQPATRSVTEGLDEIDPVLNRFEEMLDTAQFAYLTSLGQAIRDQEFINAMEDEMSKMSDEGEEDAADGRGLDGRRKKQSVIKALQYLGKSRAASVQHALRDRKVSFRLNKLVQRAQTKAQRLVQGDCAARAGQEDDREPPLDRGGEGMSPTTSTAMDINAALALHGWGANENDDEQGVTNLFRRTDLQRWIEERGHLQSSFAGIGYHATITQFERDKVTAMKNNPRTPTGSEVRKEKRRQKELATVAGDTVFLALPAFDQRGTMTSTTPSSIAVTEDTFMIVDSGTTISITDLESKTFEDFDEKASVKIRGFNGSLSKSSGSGTIVGYADDEQGRPVAVRVPRVHRVDGAPNQLLSVSEMVRNDYEFHFIKENSYVLTPEKDKLPLIEKGGLYWLKMKRAVGPGAYPVRVRGVYTKDGMQTDGDYVNHLEAVGALSSKAPREPTCSSSECEECNLTRRVQAHNVPLDLLHRRLNHMDPKGILKMAQSGDLDVNVIGKSIPVCDVCETAKAHRRSVPKVREYESCELKPFERCWTDLKGKVDRDFWGNQYIITFTCEVTRWSWVGFMKKKSHAKDMYQEFIEWVRLLGYNISILNSDSGGEFTANENALVISEFQKISKKYKITQNFTCAHTPEQNGISERLNRTLVEGGRALLVNAGLAKEFWSVAVKHLVYVKNRVWHSKHQVGSTGASPFEVLFGKPARVDQLRVWGCDAWKLDHQHRSGSWERKAKKMIYVGMAANRKGWVLFDPKTRKLSTTYHCSFDESMENRRCALRDFDLRPAKAGAGASHDEERLAKLERCLYDDNAELDIEDSDLDDRDDVKGNDARSS